MHVLVGQHLVLERRVGEVPVEFGAAGQQRGSGIRVRHGQGVLVEAVVFLVAPLLGGGVLQEARLHRNAYRRHGDAVFVGDVGDGLHVGVAADQVVREVAQRGHGLDVLSALGAVPHGQQWADAGTGDVHRTGQQCVVDGRTTRQLGPIDFDVDALLLAMFFDQMLVTHYVQQQVDDAELFGDANLAFRLRRGGGRQAADDQACAQADACRQAADGFAHDGFLSRQNGASPWMVVRYSLRRRCAGQPVARWISERLSQNTRSWGCHWWR
ncbi:hypothetical protein D3C80_846480 [compost metagenome]